MRAVEGDPRSHTATLALHPSPGSCLDPRIEEITWLVYRATGARSSHATSLDDLAQALAGMSNLLEQSWEPGRRALFTRLAVTERAGRRALDLYLGIGTLGAAGETRAESARLAPLVRFPRVYRVERVDPRPLLAAPPAHVAAVRQRWVEAADDQDAIKAPSRFDRGPDPWLELADLLLAAPHPLFVQASVLATSLAPSDQVLLEDLSARALAMVVRAREGGGAPAVASRAERVLQTLNDVSESFAGTLWVGEVAVASPATLSSFLLRGIAAAFTCEVDVVRPGLEVPVVAARTRIVGGFEIEEAPKLTRVGLRLGLPGPALDGRALRDCLSLTEASFCVRWPVALGRAIPTLPSACDYELAAPPGLPTDGSAIGRDSLGNSVRLGDHLRSHVHCIGATGAGKTTFIRACANDDLAAGRFFVLVDPHGDLSRCVVSDAESLGREIALVDAGEPRTLTLDLLGGWRRHEHGLEGLVYAVDRIVDALTAHLPTDWTGPRFRQIARSAFLIVAESADGEVGLADVSKVLVDGSAVRAFVERSEQPHVAQVLVNHLAESDRAGVGLWAASKLDDVAMGAGATGVLAPFGHGVNVSTALRAGTPLVVNLGGAGLSRLAARLLGQVTLAATIDHAMSRSPAERVPMTLYIDEIHRFPAANLVSGLSETRKFGLSIMAAHQSLSQLDMGVRDALLGNAATRLTFRVGPDDARVLARLHDVPAEQLTSLPNLRSVVSLPGTAPFTLTLEPRPLAPETPYEPPRALAVEAQANARPSHPSGQERADLPAIGDAFATDAERA